MMPTAALFGLVSVVAAVLLAVMSHRGSDEYGQSVKAYASFRAALARSDSPTRRR